MIANASYASLMAYLYDGARGIWIHWFHWFPDATTTSTQRLLRVSERQTALVALFHNEALRTSDETTSLQLLDDPNSREVT